MSNNVIVISYPSGGFGNFLFHVLTEFANDTYKVPNDGFLFSTNGNSHNTTKYTSIYFHDPDHYTLMIPDPTKKTIVLCDNGINNDTYHKVKLAIPNCTIIRLCITEKVKPVIYQTCTVKALRSDVIVDTLDQVSANWTDAHENYAARENFTLMYHNWKFKWEYSDDAQINLSIEELITNPVSCLTQVIRDIGSIPINLDKLDALCGDWQKANQQYFKVYYDWAKIEAALDTEQHIDISNIIDLHSQGYINYCIEKKYDIVIPVYDYRDWFTNTKDIAKSVEKIKNEKNSINNK